MAWPAAVGGQLAGIADEAVSAALATPVETALAAFAVVVVLLVLWVGYRRLRRTTAERFERTLQGESEIAVLMHPNPDPDTMAAALAVTALAEAVGTAATMQFPGQIRHQENRVFQNVLELDLDRIESVEDLAAPAVVLVDHNEARGFDGAGEIDPLAVVDHHPGGGTGTAFTDVRPTYGATATILAEYLDELGFVVDPDADRELSPDLATALLYGIHCDTDGFTKGFIPADFIAGSFLCGATDTEKLERITNPQVDAEVLDVRARAIANRVNEGPYVVSDVGEVSNVDAIAQAADELLRMEGTSAVVVYGERDGRLHLSGRSRDDRIHMGRALRVAVEEVPMAQAGGHRRMGGGQLPIEHMDGLGPSDGLSREDLPARLFDAMAGDV